jgi:hypothetical protein
MATDTTEIQRITRNYFEKLHASKLENLEEMDKFLDLYMTFQFEQREPVSNEIESVIKSLSIKKTPGLGDFTAEFYQILKEE